jgi:hypothetical protein
MVPRAWLGALTSKAGMSFSFMGIMLATPPSIKDSGCGLALADRPRVLSATASLLDSPAAGAGYAGRGAVRNLAAGELAGTVLAPAALPLTPAQHLGAVDPEARREQARLTG